MKVKKIVKKLIKKSKFLTNIYRKYLEKKENQYIQEKNISFQKNGKEVFAVFLELCYRNKINCWLVYGTLLGYIRENGILKHDFDFDVGIWYKDYSKDFENLLKNNGFNLKHQFTALPDYDAFEQTYEKNGVTIDVFYHYENSEKIWTHVFYKELFDEGSLFRIRKLDYPKDSLKQVVFLGKECFIPNNAEIYLEEIYGKNWRIPDQHFDWRKGSKNNCTVPDKFGKLIE